MEHMPEVDRPMLAYIRGNRFSLAVDAGYSEAHVQAFYDDLQQAQLARPDFTVLTHWHYDHTFGMHAVSGICIAHENTNAFLKNQQKLAEDPSYMQMLKKEDVHFAKEYSGKEQLQIVPADVTFSEEMTIDLGGITARIFHTVSPHSEDTVCIYVPEERVLFLGDATSEDFFNGGYLDREKLRALMQMIEAVDCDQCILSHCEPLSKADLLGYLETLL